jgi:hypothetical protein
MDHNLVHRYLSQARIGGDLAAIASPITEAYESTFAEVKRGLRFGNGSFPDLFLAYTPEARVETLEIGGDQMIVYDQYLGQSFNRLNDFALAEWPQSYVIQWGFKHLAVALAGFGDTDAAGAALLCSQVWPVEGRPYERSRELRPGRSMVTAIQEHFVLAHECVHAAIAGRAGEVMGPEVSEMIDEVAAFLDAYEPDLQAFNELMIRDEMRAVQALSEDKRGNLDDLEELLRTRREKGAAAQDRSVAEMLARNPGLREELLCDQVAASFVVAKFSKHGADLPTILASILHGFHNLTSLNLIRGIARKWCGRSHDSDLDSVVVRKGIWRTVMREFEAPPELSEEVHERFVEITELHARTVGDHFVFILPYEFDRLMAKMGSEKFDRESTLDAIRAIASQATEMPAVPDLG